MNNVLEKPKLIGEVYLFLFKEKETLLLLRVNTGYGDGMYSVIAGHLEHNESIKNGMVREAYEEAGIKIKPEDLKLIHVMHRKNEGNDRVGFFFTCDKWENEIINNEPEKCAELKWFFIDKMPKNMVQYVKEAFDKYFSGELYSDLGY
ncbi:MAG: NUDIX domain-containing protein [Candidatus Sericytochromatia bacterium]